MPNAGTHATKTVFLHVGCRKSGTSALQLGLSRGADALREAGLEQPLEGRGQVQRGLVKPLLAAVEGDVPAARKAVARLAAAIRDSDRPRHLVTLEALAEMPAEATALVAEGLAEFDTRVVVTARPWALTIPSEWQQLVKSRFTGEYVDFARAVRDGQGPLAADADRFRRRQDVADVARRWRAGAPDLPVHVILVPPSREVRPGLTDLFCDVVGIDPTLLAMPDRLVNQSLTHDNAEVLRLVNVALGDRLPNLRTDYRDGVRKWIAVRTMMRGATGSRIRIPRELEGWARGESARQLDELRRAGCDVRGDADAFVDPDLPGDDFVPASDAEVARAAAATLADLAEREARQQRRARRAARTTRKAARRSRPAGGPAAVPTPQGVPARVRRAAGAVRRRVRQRVAARRG